MLSGSPYFYLPPHLTPTRVLSVPIPIPMHHPINSPASAEWHNRTTHKTWSHRSLCKSEGLLSSCELSPNMTLFLSEKGSVVDYAEKTAKKYLHFVPNEWIWKRQFYRFCGHYSLYCKLYSQSHSQEEPWNSSYSTSALWQTAPQYLLQILPISQK